MGVSVYIENLSGRIFISRYNSPQLMRRSVVADTCVEGSIYRLNALKKGAVGKIYESTFLAISGALCRTKHADAK